MNAARVKCSACDNLILSATAEANGGLCGPCSKGSGYLRSPSREEMRKLQEKADNLNHRVALEAGWDPEAASLDTSDRLNRRNRGSTTWEHPELGMFIADCYGERWEGRIEVPAFQAFALENSYEDEEPDGKIELIFDRDEEGNAPSDAMLALVRKVLDQQAELVPRITRALWDDFHGKGLDSGMWWHGEMDEVFEELQYLHEKLPEKPDDLLIYMGEPIIQIHQEAEGNDGPLAELNFRTDFDMEHGVGILTDGDSILGMGYASQAMLYTAQ